MSWCRWSAPRSRSLPEGRSSRRQRIPPASPCFPGYSASLRGQYYEQALMHFLQTRCVTYAMDSRLNFDFKQPEQRLRRDLSACYRDRVATFNGSVRLSYRRRSKLPSSRKSCCRTSPIISRQKSARRRSPTIACRRFRQRLPSSRSPAVSQASKQTRCI